MESLDASQRSVSSAAVVKDQDDPNQVVASSSSSIENNTPRTPVSLPDLDDTSMNKVFTYLEFYEQDLAWSFFSDSFFIVGGVLSVILSTWDFHQAEAVDDDNNSNVDDPTSNNSTSSKMDIYGLLNAMAPLAYFLNSLIDIQWAYHAKLRNKKKMEVKNQWMEYQDIYTSFRQQQQEEGGDAFCTLQTVQKMAHSRFELLWKHAAHRRTILAAFTFGIAALCAFLAVLVDQKNDNNKAGSMLDFISAHMYIVSAVIATSGQRTRPWFATIQWSSGSSILLASKKNPEILEDIGDALFLVGSLVDAALFDFRLEKPLLSCLSSLLWLIDACFYLTSDFVMAHQILDNKRGDIGDSFVFV